MYFILATTLLVAAVSAKGKPFPGPIGISLYTDTSCTTLVSGFTADYPIVLGDICQPFPDPAGTNSVSIASCPPGTCSCQFYTSTDCSGAGVTVGFPAGTLGPACGVDVGFASAACRDFAN
jgi:hypothetical protein